MPLPAIAALLARAAPAMIGGTEGLLGALIGRTGLATGGQAAAGAGTAELAGGLKTSKGLSSLLGDLLANGLAGGTKPNRETDDEAERRKRRVPSAADLLGHMAPPTPVGPRMPIPLARTTTTATAGGNPGPGFAGPMPQGNTFTPTPAGTQNQATQQTTNTLQKFGSSITKMLGPLGKQIAFSVKVNTALYAGAKALETFVWGVSESNRGLARWNGEIAASFAQLDIANMRRDIATGKATAGTSTAVNSAFNDLLDEMQPIRESVATAINTAAVIAARVGQLLAWMTKFHPLFMAMNAAMGAIEQNTKKSDVTGEDPLADFLKAFRFEGGLPGAAPPPGPIPPPAWLPPLA